MWGFWILFLKRELFGRVLVWVGIGGSFAKGRELVRSGANPLIHSSGHRVVHYGIIHPQVTASQLQERREWAEPITLALVGLCVRGVHGAPMGAKKCPPMGDTFLKLFNKSLGLIKKIVLRFLP